MFGFLGGKDWNVVGIIFERPDLFRVNGNRGRGGEATTIRDNVKQHARTIFWAVFNQKGALLESAQGPGATSISSVVLQRLVREVVANPTVREVLKLLESGKETKVSKPLVWGGYPLKTEAK